MDNNPFLKVLTPELTSGAREKSKVYRKRKKKISFGQARASNIWQNKMVAIKQSLF